MKPQPSLAVALAVAGIAMGVSCRSASGANGSAVRGEAEVVPRTVEDVFLLTGELRAVRSESIVTPRSEGPLQIRWMAEDGSEVAEGDRVLEFDAATVIQRIEERRLRLRQAENERESRERTQAAEGDRKRVAVDKAEVEAEKARVDAEVPRELRSAVEYRRMQAVLLEKQAALDKARLDHSAFDVSARSDLEVARRTEEKVRREVDAAEKTLASMSVRAPRSGVWVVSNYWQWGPEGPRKLQPGDTVWPGYGVASIPDTSSMEVSANLSEVDHGRIEVGMTVRCILDTYQDRTFEGKVEEVRAVAAEPRRLAGGMFSGSGFPVRISLSGTDPVMRPGLSVRVEVVRKAWKDAPTVPRQAVRFEGERAVVVRKGKTEATAVQLAGCTPTDCVLQAGLAEGDDVVVH
jgi:multidrug resistance efflux pump